MAGEIAHAFYRDIPPHITEEVWRVLDDRLKGIVQRFTERFGGGEVRDTQRPEDAVKSLRVSEYTCKSSLSGTS